MRIDKYLCDAVNMSRNDAKKAISAKRVTADGEVVRSGSYQVQADSTVLLDGLPVRYQRYVYIMLNKPEGYVCANRDSRSKTVFDLIPEEYQKKDLFVCGRLDKNTTGLVLITNNGEVAHRLLAPKKRIFKEYLVTSRDKVRKEDIDLLEAGITLNDGLICKPAYYKEIADRIGVIQISEGKFHQIKRMFAAIGNEVVALHRRSIHGLMLDPNLPEGSCRYLTASEIQSIESVC